MDITADMGSLVFASGSGSQGYLGKLPISDKSEAVFREYVKERGYRLAPNGDMAAGDASFHNAGCCRPHRAITPNGCAK